MGLLAVKILSLEKVKTLADQAKITREIKVMVGLKSDYIVQLFDVLQTPSNLYIIMELCGLGNLEIYRKINGGKIAEQGTVKIMKDIFAGFKELQAKNIIHRDIKPANILLGKDGKIKIADFGFARFVDPDNKDPQYFTRVGTPRYCNPQILNNFPFSDKGDVWSCGILFYELLYGNPPWDGKSIPDLTQKINNVPLGFPKSVVVSEDTKKMIGKMLQKTEQDRISWTEIFELYKIKS